MTSVQWTDWLADRDGFVAPLFFVSIDTSNKQLSSEKTSWVAMRHVAASLQITMFLLREPGTEK